MSSAATAASASRSFRSLEPLVMSGVALLVATSFVAGPGLAGSGADRAPGDPPPQVLASPQPDRDGIGARPRPVQASQDSVSVVTASDGLDAALVAAVLAVDGVLAASRSRSGTVGLFGSVAADGVARDVPPAGMRIPANVSTLDPATYPAFLGAAAGAPQLELLDALQPGDALLSRTSARLRDLGPGARVDLGALAGLRIVGVVDDAVARGSEFLVHVDDADRIGLGARESLLIRSLASIEPALEGIVARGLEDGAGEHRVRSTGPRVPIVLPATEVKLRFGEFAFRLIPGQREVDIEREFVDRWITTERMPVLGNVRCHRLIMDDLRAAIEESVAAGYGDWLSPRAYGGCFHPRRIATGRENLSRHAWGIAIDLNVDFAQPGGGAVPPDEFILIWGRNGFRWGGDFATPDNHHFEWVGSLASVRPEQRQDPHA